MFVVLKLFMICRVLVALTLAIPMGDAASVVVAIADAGMSKLRGACTWLSSVELVSSIDKSE